MDEASTDGAASRDDHRLAVQVAVARALSGAETVTDATERVLGAIGGTLGWRLGAVWEGRDRELAIRCVATWHAEGAAAPEFEEASRDIAFEPGVGLPGRVWESGEAAWIRDVTQDPNFPRARLAADAGVHGAFAFPIRSRRGVIGVVEFFTRDVADPDEYLLDLMATIGYQLGQQMERSRAETLVRDSEARKSAMLDASLDAIVSMDHLGRVVEFNAAAERTFGYAAADVVGEDMAELIIPPSLRERHREGLRGYMETGHGPVLGNRIEITAMRSDGRELPVELTIVRAPLDGPPLFTGFIRDISERRRREELERFLAQVGALLGASLDYEATLDAVVSLAVPAIADWCAVDLVSDDGSIRRVAAAHTDPTKAELARELGRRWPSRIEDEGGFGKVIRTGEVEHFAEIPPEALEAIARTPEHLAIVRDLGLRSSVIVPLTTGHGRILGGLALVTAESGRLFEEVDVTLATELARRCAVAIENARLYRERDWIARTLQQSLLPPDLPEIPGVTLEARFRPAGEGIEMGGDFYDAFALDERTWVVTIGDVCGKGPDAAALTARVRYTLRAVTMHERRPGRVLELVNQAILRDGSEDRFCSAAFATIERRPHGVHVEMASAGHPLPVLLRADHSVETVGASGQLLGLWPEIDAPDVAFDLEPDESLVLYTDGVTDALAPVRILDAEDLAGLVSGCAGLAAAGIAERVVGAVVDALPGEPRDDIALLVIQTDGSDLPRDELDGTAQVSLANEPQAPARARRAVEALAGPLPSELVEELKLLATELVTNSCRHAEARHEPVLLELSIEERVVRLAVTDAGSGFEPPAASAEPEDEAGRGLFIVDALADRWGVDRAGGTRVWAELDLPAYSDTSAVAPSMRSTSTRAPGSITSSSS
ncbi:MAG TPA: SpoIIE family protein phosphatase [Thermoleophilaceae bacterium]